MAALTIPPIFDLVGNTPLIELVLKSPRGQNVILTLKLEGRNPSGSIKDRAAVSMLRDKIDRGELSDSSVILDASSGNMANALALFGRSLGIDVHLVCNANMTPEKRRLTEFYGARIIDNDFGPFTFDGIRKCRVLLQARPDINYCFLDQLHNFANPSAHQSGTGPEIAAATQGLRAVVGSVGSGGTMLGVARYLKPLFSEVRIAGVVSGAGYRLPGVGAFNDGEYVSPFILAAKSAKLFDNMISVQASDVATGLSNLRDCGIFGGAQTGAVVAAALRLADTYHFDRGIVVISADAGWKDITLLNTLV